MKSLTCLATVVFSLGVIAPLAMASSATISMVGLPGGTIAYNATTQELTGTNISIDLLQGNGTPLNNGAISLVTGTCGGAGCLDFTTGKLSNVSGNIWTFLGAGTDTFTVTGAATGAGVPSSTTLLQLLGSFSTAEIAFEQGGVLGVVLQGSDQKAAGLLNYFGIPLSEPFNFNSSMGAANGPTSPNTAHSFTADTGAGEVTNVSVGAIPEPSSVILLLTAVGATGFMYRARSRRSKRVAS